MISTNVRAIRYQGNGSTTQPYAITFPFLRDAGNIRVRIIVGETETDLGSAAFTVHDPEGAAPYVTTAAAYPSTTEVIVFRWVPFTQPLDLPEGSRFPAESVEDALDRLTMLTMQIGDMQVAGIEPGITVPAEGLQDVPSWADDAARGAVKPARAGQLGYQRDSRGIYFARSTAVGDWQLWTGPITAQRLTLAAVSDTGTPGATATALASLIAGWSVDAALFIGDNHYAPATFAQSWAPFDSLVAAQKVYPALGNHDVNDWAAHASKFSYLGSNTRYYRKSFGNGLLDVFVLHSGVNSAMTLVEPDGNAVGSVQHQWFVQQLALSTARWKLVAFHHPALTVSEEANRVVAAMDWPEFAQVDGILCGHVHFTEWLTLRGVPLVNVSGNIMRDGNVADTLNLTGSDPAGNQLLWHDDRRKLATRLHITTKSILVAYHDIETGGVVYQRELSDTTGLRGSWGQEILSPDTAVPLGAVAADVSPVAIKDGVWMIAVNSTATDAISGKIMVDSQTAATWTLPAGAYYTEATAVRNLRRGAGVWVDVTSHPSYGSGFGLAVHCSGNLVS